MSNVFRSLPTVGELLESPPLKSLVSSVSHNVVVTRASQFLDDLRGQLQNATGVNIPTPSELAERIAKWIATERGGLRRVINATGVLLHPQLSGPPLAESAVSALAEVGGGFAPLEYDLAAGVAAERDQATASLSCRLTGAEAAHVAGTHAGAALGVLAATGAKAEVLVARSQIGHLGSRKLTEIVVLAGADLARSRDNASGVGRRISRRPLAIARPQSCCRQLPTTPSSERRSKPDSRNLSRSPGGTASP